MVTIENQPYLLQGSKNPVEFKISTDKYETIAATPCSYSLEFANTIMAGDTLLISLQNVEYAFEFVDVAPDDTGLQIPHGGADPLTNWLDYVVIAFNNHFDIGEIYDIVKTNGTTITFNAKYDGAKYALEFIDDSSGEITVTPNAGLDAIYNPNFSIAYHLYWGTKGTTTYPLLISSGSKIPDANSELYFNFEKELDASLHGLFPRPDRSLTEQINEDSIGEYFVVFTEQYGSPIERKKKYTSDVKYVIKGGLSFIDFPSKKDLLTTYTIKWFTPLQATRHATPDQDLFMNFAHPDIMGGSEADDNVSVHFFVHYTDGTINSLVGTALVMDKKWQVGVFNCGFEINGLHTLDSAKTPYKFTVRLGGDNGWLVNTYQFNLIESGRLDKVFHYRNSLGVYDTIRMTGVQSYGIQLSFSQIKKSLPDNYSALFFEDDHTEHQLTHQYTCASGQFYTLKELLVSLDALLSEDIFFYDDSDRQVKILIKKGKVKLFNDEKGLWAYSFNYSIAFTDINFS